MRLLARCILVLARRHDAILGSQKRAMYDGHAHAEVMRIWYPLRPMRRSNMASVAIRSATLDDLREAVTTLEDTLSVARRVLGRRRCTQTLRWTMHCGWNIRARAAALRAIMGARAAERRRSKPENYYHSPIRSRHAQPVHLVDRIVVHERRAHDTGLETGRRDEPRREELAAAHRDVQGATPFNNSLRRYRRDGRTRPSVRAGSRRRPPAP